MPLLHSIFVHEVTDLRTLKESADTATATVAPIVANSVATKALADVLTSDAATLATDSDKLEASVPITVGSISLRTAGDRQSLQSGIKTTLATFGTVGLDSDQCDFSGTRNSEINIKEPGVYVITCVFVIDNILADVQSLFVSIEDDDGNVYGSSLERPDPDDDSVAANVMGVVYVTTAPKKFVIKATHTSASGAPGEIGIGPLPSALRETSNRVNIVRFDKIYA